MKKSKIKNQKSKTQTKNKKLPIEWRRVKLGEIVEIIDGDRGVNYPKNNELLSSGDCVFLNAKNVSGINFDFTDVQFITKDKDRLLRSGKMKRGDFVLTTRGTVGNIAYYGDDIPYDDVRINSGMVILRPQKDVINEKFFHLFLISQNFRDQIEAIKSGSAQPQLPIRDLKLFEINLPSIDRQKNIAQTLFPINDKIELNNKIIKTLEEMAAAIFKEWFIDSEKLKVKSEKLKGWEAKNIMGIIKRLPVGKRYDNRTALPKGKIPILDQGQSGIIGFHNEKLSIKASPQNPIAVFSNHTCYYRLVTFDFSCIQNVIPYIGINGYPTLFLYFLTKDKIKMSDYKGHWSEFAAQKFVIPPQELAIEFSKKIQPFIEIIDKNQKENQTLAALRDLLLPKLMKNELTTNSE